MTAPPPRPPLFAFPLEQTASFGGGGGNKLKAFSPLGSVPQTQASNKKPRRRRGICGHSVLEKTQRQ